MVTILHLCIPFFLTSSLLFSILPVIILFPQWQYLFSLLLFWFPSVFLVCEILNAYQVHGHSLLCGPLLYILATLHQRKHLHHFSFPQTITLPGIFNLNLKFKLVSFPSNLFLLIPHSQFSVYTLASFAWPPLWAGTAMPLLGFLRFIPFAFLCSHSLMLYCLGHLLDLLDLVLFSGHQTLGSENYETKVIESNKIFAFITQRYSPLYPTFLLGLY